MESVTEKDRDTCIDQETREDRLAVMQPQTAYTLVDEKRRRIEKDTRSDDKQIHFENDIPEVITSTSHPTEQFIRKAIAENQPGWTCSTTLLQRTHRFQNGHKRLHWPWILKTTMSSESASPVTLLELVTREKPVSSVFNC